MMRRANKVIKTYLIKKLPWILGKDIHIVLGTDSSNDLEFIKKKDHHTVASDTCNRHLNDAFEERAVKYVRGRNKHI